MTLLQIFEAFVLVHLPRIESLNGWAPLSPHLLVRDSSDIEGGPNIGMLLAPKVLRLNLGFFIGGEFFIILHPRGKLLLHDEVFGLDFLPLGFLASSVSHKLLVVVLGAQYIALRPRSATTTTGERWATACGLLMDGKQVAIVTGIAIAKLLLQKPLQDCGSSTWLLFRISHL